MIPKIHRGGTSFRDAIRYVTTDPKAKTAERVDWVQTLNCVHDDAAGALAEFETLYQMAEQLKAESGVREGGRPLKYPCKHVSLSWGPAERPTKEDMLQAAQSFLRHMGWFEAPVIIARHNDKTFAHCHIVLLACSPVTGKKLNTSLERRRAQKWALEHEKSLGIIQCPERLKAPAERERSPPRPIWEVLRQSDIEMLQELIAQPEDDLSPGERAAHRLHWQAKEWKLVRSQQKNERLAFMAEGKSAYRALREGVYRTVQPRFKKEWAAYFAQKRAGLDRQALSALRSDITARRNAALEELRAPAAAQLRQSRDLAYQSLLARQQEERAQLVARQEKGLASPHVWAREPLPSPASPPSCDANAAVKKRTRPPEHGLTWTARGGMFEQMRSANRWVEQIRDRLSRQAAREAGSELNPGQEPPARRPAKEGKMRVAMSSRSCRLACACTTQPNSPPSTSVFPCRSNRRCERRCWRKSKPPCWAA